MQIYAVCALYRNRQGDSVAPCIGGSLRQRDADTLADIAVPQAFGNHAVFVAQVDVRAAPALARCRPRDFIQHALSLAIRFGPQ